MAAEVKLHTEEYWSLEIANTQVPRMTNVAVPGGSFTPNDFRHENDQAKSEATTVPGTVSWTPIAGSRIMDDDTTIQDWFLQGDSVEGGGGGKMEKKEAVLYLRDAEGNDIKKWSMTGVWISTYSASGELDAGGGEPIQEAFTLNYDKMTVEA